ncbi:MAG: methylmalonyl-CoA mutase family protein [Crenarchaeota archaeon]|nr:methylmalonyl-CoA mutase family protein [Thermoproteota archaeon]HJJ21650.1 methylmalonyl-CoA mutase family protein [Nitrosopumilus sp.]MDA0853024.1 methylmalonyl-CoA mutase family protein [Thermoproteota archaeon]MDA1123361.1 methylmalonyl-CoA mutase family protein [Thermoproteota archaeon]HJJ23875.1 methylmalonyl-CoA mutase family protein [Nitrosopumilus sp.]
MVAKKLTKSKATEKQIFTDSEYVVKRIYQKSSKTKSTEDAGTYPFTRGIHPEMFRERFWTMRQYSGFGDAKLTNERFKFMLEKGQTGLSMAFDLPTQIGYDSDSPQAEGEVGKVGVSITSIKDMMIAFDGIPLGKVSSSMTINSTASTLLAYYIAVGESQGFKSTELRGTTQNDILKEYIARNTYIYPPQPSMRLIGDMIEFCADKVPSWYPVSISGYHMREAGCTATQEIAFTLANAIAYIETCLEKGLKIDDFAPRLSFFFCCTIEFFEEVAKFRVARKIYAKILKEKFHAKNPRSLQLKFHTQTSGESLTAQQPNNNIVRVAIQTMAAVAGGTQSLHTNSRDEALALPTQESAKIALRTQQIIAHESGITKTADPLAGSYYLEELCDQIEIDVWKYLKKIEKMGGSVKAIEKGFFQSEIRANAYRLKKETDDAERIIVGVNKYSEEEQQPELLRIDGRIEIQQNKAIKKLRADRDSKKLENALSAMQSAADTEENLMPYIVTAAKAFATTGEISNTFREVFGEYRPKEVF